MINPVFRKIFFWILVVLFCITTPLVIFYSLGYRFNSERGIFVFSGSVTIKSNPVDADVSMDGQSVTDKKLSRINSSYHIDGIRPGEHQFTVSLPDYKPWTKKVVVNSGLSSEFWNVLLVRNSYSATPYNAAGTSDFFLSPKRNLVATVSAKEEGFSVSVLNLDTDTSENIFSADDYSFFPGDKDKENIEWSPQADKMIIPVKKDGQRNYFIVDAETKEAFNLAELSKESNISNSRWDPSKKDVVYFLAGEKLFRMDITAPEDKTVVAENLRHYDISSDGIYYFQLPGGIVYRKGLSGSGSAEQITTAPPEDMNGASCKVIVYDEKRIALIGENGKLFLFNKGEHGEYFSKLSDEAVGVHFSNDGKKLLFWNEREIGVHFTRDWDVQPIRQENETIDITRFSQPISNVQWAKTYEHVMFTVNGTLKVAELDHRDYRNASDIIQISQPDSKVVSNFSEDKVFFIDKNGEITTVFSIDFPDKTSLF